MSRLAESRVFTVVARNLEAPLAYLNTALSTEQLSNWIHQSPRVRRGGNSLPRNYPGPIAACRPEPRYEREASIAAELIAHKTRQTSNEA